MQRRILDAAKLLFAKNGVDNVSMRRIAGAIEYSPAAIYRYFKNKREILSALRDEGFSHFLEQGKQFEVIENPLDRLRAMGRGYIRFAMEQPDYFYLMFCTDCSEVNLDGKWAERPTASFDKLKDLVNQCIGKGYFKDVNEEALVFNLWSTVHGIAHLVNSGRLSIGGDVDLENFVEQILEVSMRLGVSTYDAKSGQPWKE